MPDPKPTSLAQRPLSRRTVLVALAASALIIFGGVWLALRWIDASFDRRTGEPLGNVPISGVTRWGFNLDGLIVPRGELIASAPRKDDIPALIDPDVVPASKVDWLEPDEHVIGVTVGGESRAWPLSYLEWHRIVNDTVGGEPIAVTWHPMTASGFVFSRRVGGETLDFGVTGLLYKANLVFFDRRGDPNHESLWSQVRMQAISGPAAGRRLDVIDCELLPWAEWHAKHPGGSVLSQRTNYPIKYVATWMYWPPPFMPPPDVVADERVSRLAAAPAKKAMRESRTDLLWRSPVVVLIGPKSTRAYPFADLKEGASGEVDGIAYRLRLSTGIAPGVVMESDSRLKRVYMDWALWTSQ